MSGDTSRDPDYITRPGDVTTPSDWMRVGDTLYAVLGDKRTGGLAHLTYAGALDAARAIGADLPTREEIAALHDAAKSAKLELAPVTLPDAAMLREAGIDPADGAAKNKLLNAKMGGETWANIHDNRVLNELRRRGWDGKAPAAGMGKYWMKGAPRGRAYIKGWRLPSGTWIQAGADPGSQGPHNDAYHDYATTTLVVRRSNA